MNLSGTDLNLLFVLSVVLEEQSVTRAARRLHVTAPAVSNSLARLRALLGDPLVVRSGRGLVPTPRGRGPCSAIRSWCVPATDSILLRADASSFRACTSS